MTWFDWFLVLWFGYGAFFIVANVGKPRKPIEPMTAAISVVISAGFVGGLLVSRGAL